MGDPSEVGCCVLGTGEYRTVTDAEREAADADLAAAREELLALRARMLADMRRLAAMVHDLVNVLAIVKGEGDLLAARGRSLIDEFYERWPELKGVLRPRRRRKPG